MYKYFAFISFQSADAREAVRLQHAIEHYRLPAVLCRQDKSIPKRIKPLFCYLNDIHAGEELMQELKQRMEQSRYLIIVCSPHSAQSAYVNSGIDYFVSLGRRDCIIPVIIDGVPYSGDPATECFPEALRRHFPKHADPLKDHSILGINIHETGAGSRRAAFKRAMLMVVARMLQLDFDGLLLREQQRRRKRIALLLVVVASVLGALGATWHYSQPVPVTVAVQEATPHNASLPPLQGIAGSLYLRNEVKTDTIPLTEKMLTFHNIPKHYIGKHVRLELKGTYCLSLDTTLVLQPTLTLPLQRDTSIFGAVHFRVRGISEPEKTTVHIAGQTIHPQPDGLVEANIPIEAQRTAYLVEANGKTDTLYMPCGEDDILWLR